MCCPSINVLFPQDMLTTSPSPIVEEARTAFCDPPTHPYATRSPYPSPISSPSAACPFELQSRFHSTSSSLSSSLVTGPSHPSRAALDNLIRQILENKKVFVSQWEEVESRAGNIHRVYLLHLSEGTSVPPSPPLVLILPPPSQVRLLRIEHRSLETVVELHRLVDDTKIDGDLHENLPRLLTYDFTAKKLGGTSFVLTTFPTQWKARIPLLELETTLRDCCHSPVPEGDDLTHPLDGLKSCTFGPLNWPPSRRNSAAAGSWRGAFRLMMEDAVRDGEEMLVTLPYDLIRACLSKWGHALDGVTEATLLFLKDSMSARRFEDGDAREDADDEDQQSGSMTRTMMMMDLWGGATRWAIWGDASLQQQSHKMDIDKGWHRHVITEEETDEDERITNGKRNALLVPPSPPPPQPSFDLSLSFLPSL